MYLDLQSAIKSKYLIIRHVVMCYQFLNSEIFISCRKQGFYSSGVVANNAQSDYIHRLATDRRQRQLFLIAHCRL
jgi:hypothetical protein